MARPAADSGFAGTVSVQLAFAAGVALGGCSGFRGFSGGAGVPADGDGEVVLVPAGGCIVGCAPLDGVPVGCAPGGCAPVDCVPLGCAEVDCAELACVPVGGDPAGGEPVAVADVTPGAGAWVFAASATFPPRCEVIPVPVTNTTAASAMVSSTVPSR
ncbi:hypothetical protein [Amycolatopsis pithecellobii]|uniref:Uncharacterized protein n=1 Tax=Amycolatopsis pithecellobii TaxID=664692 RepID=A0A6N7Z168_9PSEU|nr:hypothetical protein [Amycolatopsis pithecellobii]MTD55123.1 hypothetical protein [Amycolatopsis pithecellobii]